MQNFKESTLTEKLNNIASRISLSNNQLICEINEAVNLGNNAQAKNKLFKLADNEDMPDFSETILSEFIRNVAESI